MRYNGQKRARVIKYSFVFLSILVIWVAVLIIAGAVSSDQVRQLYLAAQALTVILFFIGFYRQ